MLFRSSEPSHLIPLSMTNIAVPGPPEPHSQAFSACTTAIADSLKWSTMSSTSTSEAQMLLSTRDSLDQAAVSSAVPKSPGIPVDFEVQQPKLRSTKKRRVCGDPSGGQTAVDQAGPAVALSHVQKYVMEYVGDRIAFNRISEEYCQTERLHMLELVAMADKAYTQVLEDFSDVLTESSATVALIHTLAKACEKHTTAILEGIETSHETWVQLKIQCANAESQLLACTGQFYDHLLSEAAHLSPSAFSNVLKLSMGVLPPIQHTLPLMQPTIVLATQAPTLGVLPSMGINSGIVSSAGDGDAGGDGVQEDDVPGSLGARCGEDREEDADIILVSNSPHKVIRQSITPLSSSNRDVGAGSNSGSMAAVSDRLKMTPSISTAAAQLLIQSTHTLLDHPNKSPQKTADPSNDEAMLGHTTSFDNEGQMTSPQEDDLEEDNVDSLADPGDSATQVERSCSGQDQTQCLGTRCCRCKKNQTEADASGEIQ